jgi:poly-gamma-glutamate capsule biosynthesis protein CapA/YwtB (metallophosphatase superfamily)
MKKGKSFIVHSLGNFVFFQPQHYWTQRSYGIKFFIEKKDTVTTIAVSRLYPVDVSMQTKPLTDSTERNKLIQRTQQLSNIDLSNYWN